MEQATLFVKIGNTHQIVTKITVPPFISKPMVIIWGSRTFLFDEREGIYVETFAFWSPEGFIYPTSDLDTPENRAKIEEIVVNSVKRTQNIGKI